MEATAALISALDPLAPGRKLAGAVQGLEGAERDRPVLAPPVGFKALGAEEVHRGEVCLGLMRETLARAAHCHRPRLSPDLLQPHPPGGNEDSPVVVHLVSPSIDG